MTVWRDTFNLIFWFINSNYCFRNDWIIVVTITALQFGRTDFRLLRSDSRWCFTSFIYDSPRPQMIYWLKSFSSSSFCVAEVSGSHPSVYVPGNASALLLFRLDEVASRFQTLDVDRVHRLVSLRPRALPPLSLFLEDTAEASCVHFTGAVWSALAWSELVIVNDGRWCL